MKIKILLTTAFLILLTLNIYSQKPNLNNIVTDSKNFQTQKDAIDRFDKNKNNTDTKQKVSAYFGLEKAKHDLANQIRSFSAEQNDIESFKKQFQNNDSQKNKTTGISNLVELKKIVLTNNNSQFVEENLDTSISLKYN